MRRVFSLLLAGLGLALWTVGCGGGGGDTGGAGGGETPSGAAEQTPSGAGEHGEHGAHEHGEHGGEEAEGLAALSPEDRAIAEKQGTCPVSGEELGSMGTPVKVEHNGKVAFLCCDHCKGKFDANPEEYMAKIDGGSEGEGQ